MHICTNCGKQYESAASFCGICGAPVVPMQPPVAPAPAAPQYNPAPAAPQYNPAPAAPQYNPVPAAPQYNPAPAAPQYNPAPAAPQYNPAPAAPAKPAKDMSFLLNLFGYIGKAASIFSAFFAAMAMALPYIYVSIRESSSYYSSYVYANTYYHANAACSIFALLFGLAALGFSVFTFIFAMIKRADLNTKFNRIISMLIGLLLCILSIALITTL